MNEHMAEIVDRALENLGPLTANFQQYQSLYEAIRSGDHAYTLVPSILPRMIEDHLWEDRYDPYGAGRIRLGAREFRKFIEDRPPVGLGTTIDTIRRFLGDDSHERIAFEEAIAVGKGGPNNKKAPDQPRATSGQFTVNDSNVIIDGTPSPDVEVAPLPRRSKQGNATEYAVRRLGRRRPDLLERVEAGELSPHRAMVEAGFIRPTVQVPLDPEAAVRLLVRHFRGESLARLIDGLVNWAGAEAAQSQ